MCRARAALAKKEMGYWLAEADIAQSLANLWEAAQQLPEGSERQDAFRQISSFHRRLARQSGHADGPGRALISPPAFPHTVYDRMATAQARTREDQG